jgi:retron-type reverse transcriptase
VVVINKPGKPDYHQPKAYRPISLLECMGKLLEKIVASRFNADIVAHCLIPYSQFGSRPQHCAIDTALTITHKAQTALRKGAVMALVLFDISGFFDNIDPGCTVHILRNKGFPPYICDWVRSFLTKRRATMMIGEFESSEFPLTHSTPQGSPLSPILSALFTSPLLSIADSWEHRDLMLRSRLCHTFFLPCDSF